MSLPIHIRTAAVADIPAIVALFGQIDDLHSAGVPYAFRGSSAVPRSAQQIEAMISGPNTTMLVATGDERVLGHVGAELVTVPADRLPLVPRRFVLAHDLIVDASARERGVGSALMAALERWARGRDAESVELNVWTFNQNALRLYEQLGYETQMRKLRRVLPRHEP
jgi:ribosomal protein S18 acetylase RimI-like enzyme